MALEVVTVGEFLLESMATSWGWGMGRVGVTGSVASIWLPDCLVSQSIN